MLLYIFSFLIAAALLGADQWTKFWVEHHMALEEIRPLLPPVLELHAVHNYGAAWSLFSGSRWALVGITGAMMLVVAAALLMRLVRHPLGVFSAFLILAGGIGNLLDRIIQGYVVDMLRFPFWTSYPTFNVADICVVTGCVLWLLYVLFVREDLGNGQSASGGEVPGKEAPVEESVESPDATGGSDSSNVTAEAENSGEGDSPGEDSGEKSEEYDATGGPSPTVQNSAPATPEPEPIPVSIPEPEPTPVPTSEPEPTPVSIPEPEPTPVSIPEPEPTPVPIPTPESAPGPAPTTAPSIPGISADGTPTERTAVSVTPGWAKRKEIDPSILGGSPWKDIEEEDDPEDEDSAANLFGGSPFRTSGRHGRD